MLKEQGFERSAEAVRKFYMRHRNQGDTPYTYQLDGRVLETLDKIQDMRDQILKTTAKDFVRVGRPVNADTKILCLSDLHIPFENPDIIQHAIDNHGDADILVLNGDLIECYIVSKWPKHRYIPLRWEYEIALEYIKMFSAKFPKVVLVSGNHEYRLKSFFSSQIDPVISFMTDSDILGRLADGYAFDDEGKLTKAYNLDNVYYQGGLLNWYTRIGKTIFAHPRKASGIPMRSVELLDKYMEPREEGYENIVLGHTHKIGSIVRNRKLLIEQGCCCCPLDYEQDGKLAYSPASFGYAVVHQDKKGRVDFNKTHTFYYGSGSIIKLEDIF